jgi:hypothetical protein
MAEYEPNDSRVVTQNPSATPGEPPRTGPREGETRKQPEQELPEADKKIAPETDERWQVTGEERRWSETASDAKD